MGMYVSKYNRYERVSSLQLSFKTTHVIPMAISINFIIATYLVYKKVGW